LLLLLLLQVMLLHLLHLLLLVLLYLLYLLLLLLLLHLQLLLLYRRTTLVKRRRREWTHALGHLTQTLHLSLHGCTSSRVQTQQHEYGIPNKICEYRLQRSKVTRRQFVVL
jgi:hypothetical protein